MSRAVRWSLLSAAIALGLGGTLAEISARHARRIPPAAYLIALDDNTQVRLRWKTRPLLTALALPPDTPVTLPIGSRVKLIFSDGREESRVGPERIQLSPSPPSDYDFLCLPLAAFAKKGEEENAAPPPESVLRVTSPVGVTRFVNPTIDWTTTPGTIYDVALIDPADEAAPPRYAQRVRPPLPISALESKQGPRLPTDRIFAVLVRVSGENVTGGTSRFLTTADATTDDLPSRPADLLAEAVTALTHSPARTGDAWSALARLPEPWRHCELALRLRLKVCTDLGLTAEVKTLRTEMSR